jgi:hypothetical protein
MDMLLAKNFDCIDQLSLIEDLFLFRGDKPNMYAIVSRSKASSKLVYVESNKTFKIQNSDSLKAQEIWGYLQAIVRLV